MQPPPYLSVVAASRNDDHGGDPLRRTQIFVNCFARQCEKYQLPAELILVDWNPVPDRPGLAAVLKAPADTTYCQLRVITVPAVLHDRLKYADRISFFQMIAKNAGIRRARGQFILATNIDIIFSDELMEFIARRQLDPQKMYRVDRYDIHSGLREEMSLEETLDYAWANPVRSNYRMAPRPLVKHLYGDELFKRVCQLDPEIYQTDDGCPVVLEDGAWSVRPNRDQPVENLHTNACGDFTLLSRAGWETITGYPEFEAFSFNIDSFGLAAAHYAGFGEVALLPPCLCFHIEHSIGSGWTPEGEKKLFDRLQKNEILNPDWATLGPFMEAMRLGQAPTALNAQSWGLADFELPEELVAPGHVVAKTKHPHPYQTPPRIPVSSLRSEFDLDRLTLWQERRNTPTERLTQQILGSQAALDQTVAYLRTVEKDCADRLASIHYYQDKLKTAYSDLDRNVAYLKTLEAEIAAHIKIAAERDAIIADLNERLRVATELGRVER